MTSFLTAFLTTVLAPNNPIRRVVADRLARALSGLCCCCGLESDSHTTLCSHCLLSLPRIEQACLVCGLSCGSSSKHDRDGGGDQGICSRCLAHPPPFTLCRSAFAYSSPIDQLIANYKFNERLDVGAGLSEELGLVMAAFYANLQREVGGGERPCAVISAPLHPRRLRQRGFDQAGIIAQRVARRLGLSNLSDAVQRTRHTNPQTETKTKAERQQNLAGAFEIKTRARLDGYKHVAVIDDVITTTATVSSLAATLLDAGIKRVDVWCLARAELRTKR